MKIQSMFQKDIDRPINGVVKVMQDDQQSLKDELSEYIITKELRRHFATFFDNYVKAIDTPTDKIGVWISGFFGSGKSHFLKMLSYLLANKEVDGKHAFDYFADKFDDPMILCDFYAVAEDEDKKLIFDSFIEKKALSAIEELLKIAPITGSIYSFKQGAAIGDKIIIDAAYNLGETSKRFSF